MKNVRLGRTGLKVSRLCLGTMNFGPHTDEAASHAILDRAHDAGINFIDTADVYGWKRGEGITETILGNYFAAGSSRRDRVVLATKVYGTMGDGPNDGKLSAYHIVRACEGSLRRMKTDRIDLYQMHHIDRDTPWEEIWQAMDRLVASGKVLYVGSSNFAGWHIAQACEAARARHFLGLVSEQSLYNLMDRTVELEVIPACAGYGLAFLPWSPLKGGVLGGALRKEAVGRHPGDLQQRTIEKHRPALEKWEALCDELGHPPGDVALAWVLHNPAVTSPIVGPRTMDHLTAALRALDLSLDAATVARIEAIFPGPGGAAPEAYAW